MEKLRAHRRQADQGVVAPVHRVEGPGPVLGAALHAELGNACLCEPDGQDEMGTLARGALALEMAGFGGAAPGGVSLAAMRALLSSLAEEDLDTAGAARRIGRRSGQPLPPAVLARMEAVFGHDFSHVRVHADAAAAAAAADLSAAAFAIGREIYFGQGRFAPTSPDGLELLAHELTHVVQHDEGRVPSSTGGMQVSSPEDAHEREAVDTAAEVTRALQAPPGPVEDAAPPPVAAVAGPDLDADSEGSERAGPSSLSASVGEQVSRDVDILGALGGAWDWVLGVLAGDFNEDPSVSQLIVRMLVTLIPGVDTVGDVEDLIAALYKLLWEERVEEAGVWFDLVVTAIGFIPEAGSVVKGVVKLIKKGLGNVDLGAILKLLSGLGLGAGDAIKHLDEMLAGLATLGKSAGAWIKQVLSSFGTKIDETIAFLKRYGSLLPGKLAEKAAELARRLERLGTAARNAAKKVEDQVEVAVKEIGERLGHLKGALKLVMKVGPEDAAKLFEGLKKAGRLDKLKYCDELEAALLKSLASKSDDVQVAFWKRSDAFHDGVKKLDPSLQPKLIDQLAKKTPLPANPSYATDALQHEWKHAGDFGFPNAKPGNFKIKTDGPAFSDALEKHLKNPDAVPIAGTYKGETVTHILDLQTGNNVFYRADGSFWGAWKLGPAQLKHVITHGNLK